MAASAAQSRPRCVRLPRDLAISARSNGRCDPQRTAGSSPAVSRVGCHCAALRRVAHLIPAYCRLKCDRRFTTDHAECTCSLRLRGSRVFADNFGGVDDQPRCAAILRTVFLTRLPISATALPGILPCLLPLAFQVPIPSRRVNRGSPTYAIRFVGDPAADPRRYGRWICSAGADLPTVATFAEDEMISSVRTAPTAQACAARVRSSGSGVISELPGIRVTRAWPFHQAQVLCASGARIEEGRHTLRGSGSSTAPGHPSRHHIDTGVLLRPHFACSGSRSAAPEVHREFAQRRPPIIHAPNTRCCGLASDYAPRPAFPRSRRHYAGDKHQRHRHMIEFAPSVSGTRRAQSAVLQGVFSLLLALPLSWLVACRAFGSICCQIRCPTAFQRRLRRIMPADRRAIPRRKRCLQKSVRSTSQSSP